MRVITGTARGRRLETLAGDDTRPTTDRVKEGLFSALQFEIEGRRVLDLFAGSGQLGIEALSRGAAGCVFVDKNPQAVEVIRRNLQAAHLQAGAQVICQDALAYIRHATERFDILFLDPPYAADLLAAALEPAALRLMPGGVIVCESGPDTPLPETAGPCVLARTYRYGKVWLRFYRHATEETQIPDREGQ